MEQRKLGLGSGSSVLDDQTDPDVANICQRRTGQMGDWYAFHLGSATSLEGCTDAKLPEDAAQNPGNGFKNEH